MKAKQNNSNNLYNYYVKQEMIIIGTEYLEHFKRRF